MHWWHTTRGRDRARRSFRPAALARPRLAVLGIAFLAVCLPLVAEGWPFGLEQVASRAEKLSRVPFRDPRGHVPEWLLKITYDQWRDIRFRPERSLWRDRRMPFRIQFFHPGLFYDRSVVVNVVDSDGVRPLEFSPNQFDYGKNEFSSRVPQDLGYAGLRIHYPIKSPDYYDEVIVFLGASYFRAVGMEQGFGASARALGINTALSSGEEFPFFREFWLVRPAPGASELTVLALLDSQSLTGAYRFVVRPGEQTVVSVEARLFRRREVEKLGIAPLTSMFFFGENTARSFDDYRPEVHDSDGLLMASSTGEWIWRPLDNPRRLRVSAFVASDPKGFGLIQRDRNFDHYQDLETRPELRPSVWVTPRGNWGAGRVELVEIPSHADTNDNVVAFWVPKTPAPPGEPVSFSYNTYWYGDDPSRPPGGRTVATRRDHPDGDADRFVVDFTGKQLAALSPESVLRGVTTVSSGGSEAEVIEQHVQANPETQGWRLVFQVRPLADEPVQLRAFLQQKQDALTETWSYVTEP